GKYDVVLLGDGVLACVGFVIKKFAPHKKVVSVIHGLDLTYNHAIYQALWVRHFLPALDGLIAVSEETKNLALHKGITNSSIHVLPNGIDVTSLQSSATRLDLEKTIGKNITGQHILLTAGRLVKRKGAAWFIKNVLPTIPENTLYILSGSGPEEAEIRQAITDTHLQDRVVLLGRVSDKTRNILLNTVDLFVQPNIAVPGDMEGFGIAVIEAAACGRPVVAANLEGLKDAIIEGENGRLVEPENAAAMSAAITSLLQDDATRRTLGERAKAYTREHYNWDHIAQRYISVLDQTTPTNTL
nr:glycosyltransferase family 4 protein [Candidatus Moranbacteria bacterium]